MAILSSIIKATLHNKQPPAFATLVIETKAMTQQPYSDCWA